MPLKSKFNNRSILIVDDEGDIRSLFKNELLLYGTIVYEAANSISAVEILTNHKVEIVLSDIRMAGGDGVDLLKKMQSLKVRPRTFIMTGFSDIPKAELLALGAEEVFDKPFDPHKVLLSIAEKL